MSSILASTPPGGRSAPGGETPPGGESPPGGRGAPGGEGSAPAPLGKPPRIRLRPLSRKSGQKSTVVQKVTVQPDRAKQLRDAISSRRNRPDIQTGTPENTASNQASGMRVRLGKGPYKRQDKEPLQPKDVVEHHHTSLSTAEEEIKADSEKHTDTSTPQAQLAEIEKREKASLGPAPRYGFTPDPGGPLDTEAKRDAYDVQYRDYIDQHTAKMKALEDPDRPVFGQKPAQIKGESASDYDDRYKQAIADYLVEYRKKHP